MNKTDYRNFEPFTSLAARYWKTGDPSYRRALLRLQADFHRHHYDDFWRFYGEKEIDDKDVQAVCQADWRSNTNALMEGWRLQNTLRQLAALAKSAGTDKAATWNEVLAPVTTPLPADAFDAEETANFGWTLLGAARQYPTKLVWFVTSGSVPNQKMEALAALSHLDDLLPENRHLSPLRDFISKETGRFVADNALPDGGMLEQSLNYNYNTRENLARLAETGNAAAPLIRRENARFDAMLDSIRSPSGTLPQIGNNKLGDTGPHAPAAEAPSSSAAHPYSGYYALRSGGSPDDAWLFFKNSRLQRGHLTRDNNSIQFAAFGRPLLVCGGPPDYELNSDPAVRTAREYFSEDSSLKANTVLVDGHSQAARGTPLVSAPLSPIPSVWLDTPRVTVVDGLYADGYGGVGLPQASADSPQVSHLRTVYLFKEPRVALVVDRLDAADEASHRYTQVWKFPPALATDKATLDGFREDEVTHDADTSEIRTKDPDGANVTLLHEGKSRPQYSKFYGSTEPVLGWYAPGLSTAVPAVDYHASWEATGDTVLLTWIVPSAPGQTAAIERIRRRMDGGEVVSSIKLSDGTVLTYAAGKDNADLFGTGTASAEAVEVSRSGQPEFVVANPGRAAAGPGPVKLLTKEDGGWKVQAEGQPLAAPALVARPTGENLQVAVDASAAGAKSFGVITGDELSSVPTGAETSLQPGEGLAAWFAGAEGSRALALNMPGAAPIPSPAPAPPAGAEPGWQRHERPFPKPARIYDATLRTLQDPAPAVQVQGLDAPATPGVVAVFEGWLEVTEPGEHNLSLTGHRQAALNFRGADGQLLPPLLTAEDKATSRTTVRLDRGFYPLVVTAGGFYGAIPEVSLEVTRTGAPENQALRVVSAPLAATTPEP